MKQKLFTISILLLCSVALHAQSVGIGTNLPNASAQLDINSTTKGLLIPRMTSQQRTTINSPVKGLLVFDTDNNSFWFYSGTAWSILYSEFISQNSMVHNTTNLASDNFVFGSVKMDDTTGTADNNRFFFNKAKAAFRAGNVTTNYWNNDSTGNYSFATGANTKAKGDYSTAFGSTTTASGNTSVAMGTLTTASGNLSLATGIFTAASGNTSIAMGAASTASGDYATAIGLGVNAPSYGETSIGMSNTAYTLLTNGATAWNGGDRLFSIGNGTADNARSNALTIFKNGNTGIGTDKPTSKLDVNGQVIIEQKNFGGNAGLLIQGDAPGHNYPNIAFSVKNTNGVDILGAGITGELISNTSGAEAIDLNFATTQSGALGITERFKIKGNGALAISGSTGTAGQVLTSTGNSSAPTWNTPATYVKPYVIPFNQIGDVYLTGSTTSMAIPGMNNRQFTLTQQSDVVITYTGEVQTQSVFASPNGEIDIEVYNATPQRVLITRIFCTPTVKPFSYGHSSMLENLPPGTYTMYTTLKRDNTTDGEMNMTWTPGGQYFESNKIILQVFPK